jgi:hypothetical protein
MDDKLYTKFDPLSLEAGVALDSDHTVEFVYITFRSMIAKEKAVSMFKSAK